MALFDISLSSQELFSYIVYWHIITTWFLFGVYMWIYSKEIKALVFYTICMQFIFITLCRYYVSLSRSYYTCRKFGRCYQLENGPVSYLVQPIRNLVSMDWYRLVLSRSQTEVLCVISISLLCAYKSLYFVKFINCIDSKTNVNLMLSNRTVLLYFKRHYYNTLLLNDKNDNNVLNVSRNLFNYFHFGKRTPKLTQILLLTEGLFVSDFFKSNRFDLKTLIYNI